MWLLLVRGNLYRYQSFPKVATSGMKCLCLSGEKTYIKTGALK